MNENIVVVDDLPENLRLLAHILGGRGYRVRLAPNGAHALATIQKELPDLILLDIMMPDMGGYDVCRHLKADERTRAVPVIFISSLNDVFDKLTAFSVGGVEYITKPFEEAEVLARVETHLTLHQLRRDLEQKNDALRSVNESLEEKVQARTAELAEANTALSAEIEQRIRHQAERDQLFGMVSQQSEQLRSLTQMVLESHQRQHQGLSQTLHAHVKQNLRLLDTHLKAAQQSVSGQAQMLPAAKRIEEHLGQAQAILAHLTQETDQVSEDLDRVNAEDQALLQNPLLTLSTREREVLQLLIAGRSTTEIAETLILSKGTVSTYRARIMEKLNVPDFPSLVKFAMHHHLISD